MKKNKNIDLDTQRYGLFMNEDSFDLEIEYGRHYLETDVNFTIKLYKVDTINTSTHELYNQTVAEDKVFNAPISLRCMVDIEDENQKYYGDNEGGIVREDTGNIRVGIYLAELEEKNVDIFRGDIIEYNFSGKKPRYYEVENANNVIDTSQKSIAGFNSYFKEIIGVPVKEDISKLINNE